MRLHAVTAAALLEGPTRLHLRWTAQQLRAHPRLDEDLKRARIRLDTGADGLLSRTRITPATTAETRKQAA